MSNNNRIEFGDFQTPLELAELVVNFINKIFPNPSFVIEPTCGLGTFINASIKNWGDSCHYYGFDINEKYINELKLSITGNRKLHLEVTDFFTFNWSIFFKKLTGNILISVCPFIIQFMNYQ